MATAPAAGWTGEWTAFCARLEERLAQLALDLAACWREQAALIERALAALPPAPETQPTLGAYREARRASAEACLIRPLAQWERRRPYQRALEAIESCDRGIEELLKALPERVEAGGPDLLGLAGNEAAGRLRRLLVGVRPQRPLALRAAASAGVGRLKAARIPAEHRLFTVHLRAAQETGRAWGPSREAIDAAARADPLAPGDAAAAAADARARADALARQAAAALPEWQPRPGGTARFLAAALHRAPAQPSGRRREKHLRAWTARWRALESGLRLELALEATETRAADLFARAIDGLSAEQTRVLAELDTLAAWLRERLAGGYVEAPPPRAEVVPAVARVAEVEAGFRAEIETLPEGCHVLGFRERPRRLRPRDKLYESFKRDGRPALGAVFEIAESEHRKFLQEIGRAREVAAFGLQSGDSGQLEREALENALALLEFYRGRPSDWRSAAGPRLTAALGALFADARFQLERRLGTAAFLARHGFRRAWPLLVGGAVETLARAFDTARGAAARAASRFLVLIGWKSAPAARWSEVVTRPFLPPEFRPGSYGAELPALYRHLFRFEPVEDPRFLVGREREMAAVAEARSFWEAGRPASLLIVGERGSGKTSLVNCALKQRLQDMEVVRGEFQDRLRTEAELRAFLGNLFGTDPAELERFLLDRPRVVVLEELERTFLRRAGCFGAIRALERLVAATCTRALWILSTNTVAFRFMHAAAQLGASFSHRIDAATATRDDLRRAIRGRHDLSGLRLGFAPPPRRGHSLDRFLHGEPDPETVFFNALSRESNGVFRTAFDIWLGYIDSVESGLLYMKPLDPPDLSPVIDDLDTPDLFTLVATLQHGSLTPEEHAAVFHMSLPASRARIDELVAREIVERDPGRHGFRVRPKAARVVKEALYRRNLL